MSDSKKNELKVTALTQRIGEITSKYEEQVAELRAQATMAIEKLDSENKELHEDVKRLDAKVVELEKNAQKKKD